MSAVRTATKGAATRELILDRAYGIACREGLEGLSIGGLAGEVGMSKSGVFAHFGSREDLQLAVLDNAGRRFVEHVMVPALAAPRGVARLRALMDRWFDWARHRDDGGCIFLAAANEYDDRPGPLRDRVIAQMERWRSELARAATLAIQTGELAPGTDVEQLAFELYALALVVHHDAGLRGYDVAYERGMRAFDRLVDANSPTA